MQVKFILFTIKFKNAVYEKNLFCAVMLQH